MTMLPVVVVAVDIVAVVVGIVVVVDSCLPQDLALVR